MKTPVKFALLILVVLSVVALTVAVTAHKWRFATGPQDKPEQVTNILPPVISSIKGLEIVTAYIDANQEANIVVLNKTGKPIVGLSFSSGNRTFSDDNGISQDNPNTLIEPDATYTLQEPISNLRQHEPIQLSAVFYKDGSEEGESTVRKNLHEARERQREKRLHPRNNNEL